MALYNEGLFSLEKKRLQLLYKAEKLKYFKEVFDHTEFLITNLADKMELPKKSILGKSRKPKAIIARCLLYRTLYTMYSLEDIAYVFDKHHTTIAYGIEIIKQGMYRNRGKEHDVKSYLQFLETLNKKYIADKTNSHLQEIQANN